MLKKNENVKAQMMTKKELGEIMLDVAPCPM
jgi:hypothetical protein